MFQSFFFLSFHLYACHFSVLLHLFQNIQDFYFWLQIVARTHPVWTVA